MLFVSTSTMEILCIPYGKYDALNQPPISVKIYWFVQFTSESVPVLQQNYHNNLKEQKGSPLIAPRGLFAFNTNSCYNSSFIINLLVYG